MILTTIFAGLSGFISNISGSAATAQPDTIRNNNEFFHDLENNLTHGMIDGLIYNSASDDKLINSNWGAIISVAFISIVLLSVILLAFKTGNAIDFIRKKVKLWFWFILTVIMGFFVYDIGMCTGEPISLLTNIPMAALHSLEMFALSSDVSEIHEPFFYNWIFMSFFSLAHTMAALVSMAFIIRTFGFNIVAKYEIWVASRQKHFSGETFVIWGANEASYNLVESIKEKFSDDKTKFRIVVVRLNDTADNESESSVGIDRILEFLSIRNKDLERLEILKCLTTSTYSNFMTKSLQIGDSDGKQDILGEELRLFSLKKIINNCDGPLYMIFLSEDERININATNLLLNDTTINSVVARFEEERERKELTQDVSATETEEKKLPDVAFLFHARYNSVHRVMEDTHARSGIRVKVIDSSHICVEMLKRKKDVLPVNFVKVEKDATVSTDFNALVVGFSEVGQDAVKFLYEFGAFVKKEGCSAEHVERSKFHLDVVDKHMSDLAGGFLSSAPSIDPFMPFISEKDNKNALIALYEMDCRSAEFYLKLEESILKLNYVVIATEDDELNMSIGIRIFRLAARYREDMENLCILIRVHNDDDGNNRRIKDHYNKLWAAQKCVYEIKERIKPIDEKFDKKIGLTAEEQEMKRKWDGTHQTEFRNEDDAPLPLHLFGMDSSTYTYDNIIDNTLEKEAIDFKEKYEASTNAKYNEQKKESEKAWHKEFRKLMYMTKGEETGIDYKEYYPSYGDIMSLRRKQGQDLANSLHSITKRILVDKAIAAFPEEERMQIAGIEWRRLSRKNLTTDYIPVSGYALKDEVKAILDNIARTEHLRWNASHEILGYECKGNPKHKDEVRMEHGCITEWENLDTATQSYDYNVVDVTLGIVDPDHPMKETEK